ncbi:uncharacterized protein METZ01_LOCUS152810, partial [marine metagenome]
MEWMFITIFTLHCNYGITNMKIFISFLFIIVTYGSAQNFSISFDGTDDYISTGIPYTDLYQQTSIEIRTIFKWYAEDDDGGTTGQGIISNVSSASGHQIDLAIDVDVENGDKKLSIAWSDYSNLGSPDMERSVFDYTTINFDEWYDIKVRLEDDGTANWYLDGQLVETDSVNFTSLGYYSENGVPDISIGRANSVYDTYFDGLIDEIMISTGDTLGYWKFDTGTGEIAYDYSGNANHGTIYGATWSTDVSVYTGPVWYVSTEGSDENVGDIDNPFASLQAAINASSNGDTVLVATGTYIAPNEPHFDNGSSAGPNFYEKDSLVILGEGSETTIIDLDDHYYGFIFSYNSNDNIVDGFTIKNGGNLLITALNNSYDNTFKNCVFLATGGESYTYASYYSGENFINCTFIGDGENSALYNYPTQSVITNSIFYNYNGLISENYLEELTVSYSLFYAVGGDLPTGETLIFLDPRFCDPDSNNYNLAENSPCVGSGSGELNIGALGVGCDVIGYSLYVSKFGSDDNIGSEENPLLTIQAGLNAAWHHDTVYVASGTYLENIRWPEKSDISLIGEDKDSTIIDGNSSSIVIWIERLDENFDSFGSILIKDFTIQNGYSTYVGGIYTYSNSASIELDDLNIIDNGGINGSGLYAYGSDSVSLSNVLIENNKSYTQNSFAIYSRDCNLT